MRALRPRPGLYRILTNERKKSDVKDKGRVKKSETVGTGEKNAGKRIQSEHRRLHESTYFPGEKKGFGGKG